MIGSENIETETLEGIVRECLNCGEPAVPLTGENGECLCGGNFGKPTGSTVELEVPAEMADEYREFEGIRS